MNFKEKLEIEKIFWNFEEEIKIGKHHPSDWMKAIQEFLRDIERVWDIQACFTEKQMEKIEKYAELLTKTACGVAFMDYNGDTPINPKDLEQQKLLLFGLDPEREYHIPRYKDISVIWVSLEEGRARELVKFLYDITQFSVVTQ